MYLWLKPEETPGSVVPVSSTTPELQPLRARLAAFSRWANVADRATETAPAREKFLGQFDAYPNPEAARRAYFSRLALRSAEARAAKIRTIKRSDSEAITSGIPAAS